MAKAPSKKSSMASADLKAIYQALDRIQAIIEFNLDGTVVKANDNFLKAMGYAAEEIVGQHHRMFCEQDWLFVDFCGNLEAVSSRIDY